MRTAMMQSEGIVQNQESEVTPDWGSSDGSNRPRLHKSESFHRYTLGHELASGGMASIYLARMHGPGGFEKTVVLKRMHSHLASRANSIRMFCDEANVQARIAHPNVCSVLDFGLQDGQWFMALEYVEGVTLGRLLRRMTKMPGRLLNAEWRAIAMHIAMQVAYGLHAAHELQDREGNLLGVVHRDVSPQNIMIGFDGSVRLLDFGVAKSSEQSHHTATGIIMGKFAYMSPEQITARDVDRRADIWALAVCLWEMLVARRLFKSSDIARAIKDIREGTIPPPSVLRAQIGDLVDATVMGGLERRLDRRWATAKEFGDRIFEASQSMPVRAGMSELSALVEDCCGSDRLRNQELVRALDEMEPSPLQHRLRLEGDDERTLITPSTILLAVPEQERGDQSAQIAPVATRGKKSGGVDRQKGGGFRWRLLSMVGLFSLLLAAFFVASQQAGARLETRRVDGLAESTQGREGISPAVERTPSESILPGQAATPGESSDSNRNPEDGSTGTLEKQGDGSSARIHSVSRPASRRAGNQRTSPRGQGRVNVVSLGGSARVYARGRLLGVTPGQFQLPAGVHRLRFVPAAGGAQRRARVRIQANRISRVSVRL